MTQQLEARGRGREAEASAHQLSLEVLGAALCSAQPLPLDWELNESQGDRGPQHSCPSPSLSISIRKGEAVLKGRGEN